MKRTKELIMYRINVLQHRDVIRNAAIIKKLRRELRRYDETI